MDDFIQITPEDNYDWQSTCQRLTEKLVASGKLYGDPESLMAAKANVFTQVLKSIVEETGELERCFDVPEALSSQNQQWLIPNLTIAAAEGVSVTTQHVIVTLSRVVEDLCTSKLAHIASEVEPSGNPTSGPSDKG